MSKDAARLARGSIVNLAAMVAGAVMGFGLTVLVSRWLEPAGAGAMFELIALFTILSNTFELGADTGLTRWISRARAVGGLADVRRIVVIALVPVLIIGTAAAAAMWIAAPEVARLFLHGLSSSAGAADVRFVAPLVPLGALSACVLAGPRGFGLMWPYLLVEGLGKPGVRLGLVLAALVAGWGLHGALVAWGLPVAVGLAVSWFILARQIRLHVPRGRGARRAAGPPPALGTAARFAGPPLPPAEDDGDYAPTLPMSALEVLALAGTSPPRPARPRPAREPGSREPGRHRGTGPSASTLRRRRLTGEFWSFAGPRAFAGTFQVVVLWLDVLLVGALVSGYGAGIYGAVSKLALVGTFALEGNRLAIAPQLSGMMARREYDRAADLYQSATRMLMLASWPLYIVFAVFPAVVLDIFGARYSSGAASLAVLALAMLVNLGTGNVTVVLLMGGKSSWSAINAGAALAVNIGLNLLLLPRYGIIGAAIAWAASIVVDNIAAVVEVRWVLGMAPFGNGYGIVAAATVGCFGATGAAARILMGQTLPALAVSLAAGLAAFGVTVYVARRPLQLTGISAVLRPKAAPAEPSLAKPSAA